MSSISRNQLLDVYLLGAVCKREREEVLHRVGGKPILGVAGYFGLLKFM